MLNRKYLQYIEDKMKWDIVQAYEYQRIIDTTNRLYLIWDYARDAQCEYYYTYSRRQALEKLKDLMDPEDFWTGELPFPIPLESMERIPY